MGYISSIINYGTMGGLGGNRGGAAQYMPVSITNYGKMKGVEGGGNADITIDNRGVIDMLWTGATWYHFSGGGTYDFVLKNYALIIQRDSDTFNTGTGRPDEGDNSHLIIRGGSVQHPVIVKFYDENSKMILDFDGNFEFGKAYSLDRLIMNSNYFGNDWTTHLSVEFSRLTTRSSLYKLTQSGNYFIVNIDAPNSEIGILHKSNIRTMNNFYTMSNSMIYPHKYSAKRTTNKRRVIRRVKKTANLFNDSWIASGNALAMTSEVDSSLREIVPTRHSEPLGEESTNHNKDSNSNLDSFALDSSLRALHYAQNDGESAYFASLRENERSEFSWQSILESLESNESFAYKSDSSDYYANNATNPNSTNQTRRRITTTNQTNPISNPNANRNPQITQSNDKYYFILTPFVNHNLFFESGRYNLSGLEYGFLTAFSGKITPSNALGAHFMMSYGSLGDSKDKNFNITNLNLNIGLNYKFDMIWDMYIKARGDFYYFLNQVKTLTIFEAIKPNNLGFGLSVAYGKDFNFGSGGNLGVELGIDYKALQSSNISLQNSADRSVSEIYQKSLYNLIYVDLGLNYAKYFNTSVGLWGLNANMGIKGNVTANKLAKSQILLNAFNRSVDMTLDNDKVLGYINLSGSYVLNAKDFNMEFSLAYYGNYGDRVISNGGGVEWRVVW